MKRNIYTFNVNYSVYGSYEVESNSEEEARHYMKDLFKDEDSVQAGLKECLENDQSIGIDIEFVELVGEVEYD